MKALLLSTLLFLSLGCSKKEAIQPDYTQALLGTYFMTYIHWDGDSPVNLPQNGLSGTMTVEKSDLTHVMITVSITALGNTQRSSLQKFELKPDNGNLFLLYDSTNPVGAISPAVVDLQVLDNQGGKVEFKASR